MIHLCILFHFITHLILINDKILFKLNSKEKLSIAHKNIFKKRCWKNEKWKNYAEKFKKMTLILRKAKNFLLSCIENLALSRQKIDRWDSPQCCYIAHLCKLLNGVKESFVEWNEFCFQMTKNKQVTINAKINKFYFTVVILVKRKVSGNFIQKNK